MQHKKIELTSKLGLAVIAITAISVAVGTQAYYIQVADAQAKLPNNSVRTETIVNGQVQKDDLANNAVTSDKIAPSTIQAGDIAAGVIPSGGTQPTVHVVTKLVNLNPHVLTTETMSCPNGEIAIGGGFRAPLEFVTYESHPSSSAEAWVVGVWNPTNDIDNDYEAFVKCMDFTP